MARGDRDKAAARRQAALERATRKTGRPHQDLARRRTEALASIAPSAARVVVPTSEGPRSVDPVATALAFGRGVLSLVGSGSDAARDRAALVRRALAAAVPHTVPSGLTLAEALSLAPDAIPVDPHDGAVVVARHLTDLGERHERGEVDLYARVAPLGTGRHPRADEIDILCAAVLPEEVAEDDDRPRLVVTTDEGWFEVWPAAALEAASLGILAADTADVVGEGLYRWLTGPQAQRVAADGPHALPDLFRGADVRAAVDTAAQRAGSDHPALAGPVLLRTLAPPPPS